MRLSPEYGHVREWGLRDTSIMLNRGLFGEIISGRPIKIFTVIISLQTNVNTAWKSVRGKGPLTDDGDTHKHSVRLVRDWLERADKSISIRFHPAHSSGR